MSDPLRTAHGHYLRSLTSGAPPALVARWNEACRRVEAQQAACDRANAARPCASRGGVEECPCAGRKP